MCGTHTKQNKKANKVKACNGYPKKRNKTQKLGIEA